MKLGFSAFVMSASFCFLALKGQRVSVKLNVVCEQFRCGSHAGKLCCRVENC